MCKCKINLIKLPKKDALPSVCNIGVCGILIGVVVALLLIGGCLLSRCAAERAYSEKWKDYDDCGWA